MEIQLRFLAFWYWLLKAISVEAEPGLARLSDLRSFSPPSLCKPNPISFLALSSPEWVKTYIDPALYKGSKVKIPLGICLHDWMLQFWKQNFCCIPRFSLQPHKLPPLLPSTSPPPMTPLMPSALPVLELTASNNPCMSAQKSTSQKDLLLGTTSLAILNDACPGEQILCLFPWYDICLPLKERKLGLYLDDIDTHTLIFREALWLKVAVLLSKFTVA